MQSDLQLTMRPDNSHNFPTIQNECSAPDCRPVKHRPCRTQYFRTPSVIASAVKATVMVDIFIYGHVYS